MHILWLLAFATFGCVIAFIAWSKVSAARHRQTDSGLGGPADPMSGTTDGIRDPDTLRASLDAAAARR